MTRINCVPPQELSRQHLVAEYRELPRVFTLARPCDDAPEQYVLGTGHVKFFYNKLHYLYKRQQALITEMLNRGYKPTFDIDGLFEKLTCDDRILGELWNDWQPTDEAIELNKQRIMERTK